MSRSPAIFSVRQVAVWPLSPPRRPALTSRIVQGRERMTTTTKPLALKNMSLARREDEPPVWNRSRFTFVSTCPKCGQASFQHGYTHQVLLDLLKAASKVDAYCIDCNVCWPISENERRAIAPRLKSRLQSCNGARSAWCSQRRRPRDPNSPKRAPSSRTQVGLQQALRTLRAIRLRYEI